MRFRILGVVFKKIKKKTLLLFFLLLVLKPLDFRAFGKNMFLTKSAMKRIFLSLSLLIMVWGKIGNWGFPKNYKQKIKKQELNLVMKKII